MSGKYRGEMNGYFVVCGWEFVVCGAVLFGFRIFLNHSGTAL
jgi:hypothetical protein